MSSSLRVKIETILAPTNVGIAVRCACPVCDEVSFVANNERDTSVCPHFFAAALDDDGMLTGTVFFDVPENEVDALDEHLFRVESKTRLKALIEQLKTALVMSVNVEEAFDRTAKKLMTYDRSDSLSSGFDSLVTARLKIQDAIYDLRVTESCVDVKGRTSGVA